MLIIRELRTQKQISVPQLSRLSGVPVRTIEDLERRGDGRISTIARLADALNLTLNDVYVLPADSPPE